MNCPGRSSGTGASQVRRCCRLRMPIGAAKITTGTIVRWAGFDAQETSCNLNKIERRRAAWLANFSCSGAGVSWLEEDEIRISKSGWTLEAKIKNARRVGDPIRYC